LNAWELIIQQPVINVLIVMSHYLADNFGLAIIALTIIVNLAMLPLTLSQLRSARVMQELQPRLAELQKKYAKDKQKLAQEQMRLYKESGVKPAGCAFTMIIQMPVWIAVYQAIMLALAAAPEGLLNLAKYLYPWPVVYSVLPLGQDFLWLKLTQPDMFLAILVGVTMWLQQKMSTTTAASADPRQRQQTQMMLWLMPMMFTFLALSFASGLSLYWVVNSIVRIVMQYRVTGWGDLARKTGEAAGDKKYLKFVATEEEKSLADAEANTATRGDEPKKKDAVIYPEKPSKNRYQPGKDRSRHPKK